MLPCSRLLPFLAVLFAGLGLCERLHAAATVGEPVQAAVPAAAQGDGRDAFRHPAAIGFPADNPYTPEKARLGRTLYFDPRLSRANIQSCATCHNPAFAYGDGQPKGVGDGMLALGRRSPSIVNAAWSDALMWDGRFPSLEAQALGPIQSTAEMNMPLDAVTARLRAVAGYRAMFEAAFPGKPINGETIGAAIATFERTVVSARAPFDAWVEGDEKAISDQAKRGFAVFAGKGQCAACHSGWAFTDNGFHDIGLPDADVGRGKQFPQVVKMQHAFKTPGLRETDRRGPYMHDGSLPTLEAVVEHYDRGGADRPSQSELVTRLGLTSGEKSDLVAFLKTLSSPLPDVPQPALPR